jgi:hypothetical protein
MEMATQSSREPKKYHNILTMFHRRKSGFGSEREQTNDFFFEGRMGFLWCFGDLI